MPESARQIVEKVWKDLFGYRFRVQELCGGIIDDCGVDTAGLTAQDIQRLYYDELPDRWFDVAFAFDEVLAHYCSNALTNEQFARAVCVSVYLAESIRNGHGDWAFSFDKVLRTLVQNSEKIEYERRMEILTEVLRPASADVP